MILAALLFLMQDGLLQPGANPAPQTASELPIPRKKAAEKAPKPVAPSGPAPTIEDDRLALCLGKVRSDPAAAATEAEAWLGLGQTAAAQRKPRLCLGMAQAALLRWEAAEQTFTALSLGTPLSEGEDAAAYRVMAGTAALAGGFPERALPMLDDAASVGSTLPSEQYGEIEIDRARALVALERLPEARTALDHALQLTPQDSDGWLLSATLYRRVRDLAGAQKAIEKAAELNPVDPAVGLEAGVIAMLDGREPAARKSWDSVIAAAPNSNEARIAKGYLEQIGPEQGAATGVVAKP
jgi:tetratricopeptide (TPR) repeat protein